MSEEQLPETIAGVEQLEELLSRPVPGLVEALSRLEGDILVLGASGKMGPSLARMARRASDAAGRPGRVIGVARFSDPQARKALEAHGVETIQGDLLDPAFIDALPDAPNVVYMVGVKFGTTGNEPFTWAVNTCVPALVCRKFRRSRIVAFSTGNVYGLAPAGGSGSLESDPPRPCGEYAMSCLGRERIFEFFAHALGTPMVLFRLNYAVEMRYGVLVDLAQTIMRGEPIDLSMGYANVIWQGDAAAMALAALGAAVSPPLALNVTGPERLSIRAVCEAFGRQLGQPVRFSGVEAAEALLSDARAALARFGPPRVTPERMIGWIAQWLRRGGATLGKPTHFESRDGKF
ncbi:MAG: NAD-dependent epimerase/dehydratase family protein [Thermoguttaceae bacterium]